MSLFVNSDRAPYYSESESGKNPENNQKHLSLNINERNNQKSLLYQALFLPDKSSSHTGDTGTQKCGTSINKNIIPSGFITPPLKNDHSEFVLDVNGWNTSSSLSSLSDSVNHNLNNSQSLSSGSSWNSFTNLVSSDTYSSLTNETDQQIAERLCEDQQGAESPANLNFDPTMTYSCSTSGSGSASVATLNNQCYEAAITERLKPSQSQKYIAKMKPSKTLTSKSKGKGIATATNYALTSRSSSQSRKRQHSDTFYRHNHHHDHQQQQHHNHQHHNRQQVSQQPQRDGQQNHIQQQHRDGHLEGTSLTVSQQDKAVNSLLGVTDNVADFIVPSTLSTLPATRAESPLTALPVVADNADQKNHRYNQTFQALRQSGLMKTTIKTAELLRRSRSLQQDLAKLRRDTSLFVQCVLKNPQNKHLKEQTKNGRNLNISWDQQPQLH